MVVFWLEVLLMDWRKKGREHADGRSAETAPHVLSFAELEQRPQVTAAELIATLTDYADGGWAIKGAVVISVAQRVQPLRSEDGNTLLQACQRGAAKQRVVCRSELGQQREAGEYQSVMEWVARAARVQGAEETSGEVADELNAGLVPRLKEIAS